VICSLCWKKCKYHNLVTQKGFSNDETLYRDSSSESAMRMQIATAAKARAAEAAAAAAHARAGGIQANVGNSSKRHHHRKRSDTLLERLVENVACAMRGCISAAEVFPDCG
jgi:hypothetical protein